MKLLLDENVSPSITSSLWAHDVDAIAIRDRGKLGLPDHDVLLLAIAEDRVIATANADDFTALCDNEEIHPGLITMASGTRGQQLAMITAALEYIVTEAAGDKQSPDAFMINRVVEVELDGACSSYPLPT
jgi:predicted nuclease of predicted toxin-antitoxin system